jgi:hypothetical protein
MSDPADGLPARLELNWKNTVEASEVMLVFDTGLHRHLTLSHHDGYTATMCYGQAQPETVRDYIIETRGDAGWKVVCEVLGNYQRRRVHSLPIGEPTTGLRVTVLATNGLDHARICEVRVYKADDFTGVGSKG